MAQPQRPGLLDLRSKSSASNVSGFSKPPRSPRQHLAGDVPPEMSPLDAFAMQSRLLARQLQSGEDGERRMSRLPPLTIESPLVVQGRSDYFRSMSQDSGSEGSPSPEPQNEGLGLRTEIDEPTERPKSMHPRMSRIPPTPDEDIPLPPRPLQPSLQPLSDSIPGCGRQLNQIDEHESNFGARREESPTPMDGGAFAAVDDKPAGSSPPRKANSLPRPSTQPLNSLSTSPEKPAKKNSFDGPGLAPPRPMFVKRSSSIKSSPLETTDEESVMGSSFHSLPPRKLSSASSAFSSMPAASPAMSSTPYHRSPSVSSDVSAPLPRPSFNFSRPLSRSGTPGSETPSRQASSDTQASFVLADEVAHTPVSMSSEGFPDAHGDDGKSPATSYIYSKFSLPRGKTVQRSIPLDGHPQASYQWEQPMTPPSNVQPIAAGAPPSPPSRPSSLSARTQPDDTSLPKHSTEQGKLSLDRGGLRPRPSPNPSCPLAESGRISEDAARGRALTSPPHDAARRQTPSSIATTDSASTIRAARSQHSTAPTTSDMTVDDHLAKGIECHENGSVKESTYHLRHAARLGHPTGMLLYALACRHGWGMRPNQKEGVEWLRRAADGVSLEIADDEGHAKEGKSINHVESKARKAQFALSIYELGVSHMNGWGIEQDRGLALRCFEIAGSWGDTDALAEAGYCYAQGVGCKKDLKKAAKLYRDAEAKGMSMVGNSWIHKPKYLDGNDSKEAKKSRSKSRTRTIFGLKRTNTAATTHTTASS